MRVFAIPKFVAEGVVGTVAESVAIISILDSGAERIFEDDYKTKTFWFDDIHPTTVQTISSCCDCKPMSYKQAEEMIQFIMELDTAKLTKVMVHCTAGICRSGAVVDFLRVILDVDDIQFVQDNPNIIPNTWVRDLLWSAWREMR